MAFDGLDISIGGDSAGAKGAIASVKSSLAGLERSANSAQDSVEELGDEASGTSGRLSFLGATAGASLLSLLGLSSAAKGATASLGALAASTGTVTIALVGLAAVAAPLVATVGALVAAGASLAAVFGGGIAAGVATHMEALKSAFVDARAEIMELIEPVGELFGPILVDAVEALPTLVESILDAVGPLEEFRDTLVDFGGMAMDIIPDVAGAMGDLAREALPVLEDLVESVGENAPDAFEGMMDVAEEVGDELLAVADATADLIPPLTETGVILIDALTPAVTAVVDGLGALLSGFNDIVRSDGVQRVLKTLRGVFDDLATSVQTHVMPVVRDFAERALPGLRDAADTAREDFVPLIDEVRSLAGEVQKTAAVVIPILKNRMGPAVDAFGTLAVDVFKLISSVVSNSFDIAINTLEVLMALLRGDFSGALRHGRDLARTVTDAIGENFGALKDVVVSALDFIKKYTIGRFQAIADILLGGDSGGIVPGIKSGVESTFNSLREFFATAWDLHPLSDEFEAVVDAIGSAFGRLNFGSFESALDAVANGVRGLINSLNTLSGVNIDVDVPSFGDLMDEAKSIVDSPEDGSGSSGGGGGGGFGREDGGAVDGDPNTGGDSDPANNDSGHVAPGISTGGFIKSAGAAVLHSGERVLPSSQVSDRGEASFDPASVAAGFDSSDAVSELSSKLDRISAQLSDLNHGDVSQKDILQALDVAEDRRAGRDPYST